MNSRIIVILALLLSVLAIPAYAVTIVDAHNLSQPTQATESFGNFNGFVITPNATKYPNTNYTVNMVSVNMSIPSIIPASDVRLWDNTSQSFVVNASWTANGVVNISYILNMSRVYMVLAGNSSGGIFNYKTQSSAALPVAGDVITWSGGVACQSTNACGPGTAIAIANAYQVSNITFNVLAIVPNTAPTLRSVAASVSADNLTIIISANATDSENTTIRYNTTINRSGTLEYLNYSAFVPVNITSQYVNYTVSVAGNYSVCVQANDGINTTAANCTSFVPITFPTNPTNTPPVTRSVAASLSADNLTFQINANATDVDNATIRYDISVNISNVTSMIGNTSYFPSNLTANVYNYSVTVNGNYSFCVRANDGANSSTVQLCTAYTEVILPVTLPSAVDGVMLLVISMLCVIFVVTLVYARLPVGSSEMAFYAFVGIVSILSLVIVVALISLL